MKSEKTEHTNQVGPPPLDPGLYLHLVPKKGSKDKPKATSVPPKK